MPEQDVLCYPDIDWLNERGTVTSLITIMGGSGDDVAGIIAEGSKAYDS